MTDYKHLSLAERRQLFTFIEMGIKVNEIAKRLGRSRATIYRELKRNKGRILDALRLESTKH